MSKTIEGQWQCGHCGTMKDIVLFRTIWGEYPSNREMVMNDTINVVQCDHCGNRHKVEFSLMYTNVKQNFAVWWEPEYDPQIDRDTAGYVQMMGPQSYHAKAPRIRDWEQFKETIRKFERGELKGNPPQMNSQMMGQMTKNLEQLVKSHEKKQNNGCLNVIILLIMLVGLLNLIWVSNKIIFADFF